MGGEPFLLGGRNIQQLGVWVLFLLRFVQQPRFEALLEAEPQVLESKRVFQGEVAWNADPPEGVFD